MTAARLKNGVQSTKHLCSLDEIIEPRRRHRLPQVQTLQLELAYKQKTEMSL